MGEGHEGGGYQAAVRAGMADEKVALHCLSISYWHKNRE